MAIYQIESDITHLIGCHPETGRKTSIHSGKHHITLYYIHTLIYRSSFFAPSVRVHDYFIPCFITAVSTLSCITNDLRFDFAPLVSFV